MSLPARRLQVGLLIDRGISQRRACRLIGVARSALKYASILDTKDSPLIAAMRRLSGQYPRYGYRPGGHPNSPTDGHPKLPHLS